MPILANARHERFAQAIAAGRSTSDAYVEAGYAPNRQNAARLTTNDDIATRIAELKGRAAEGLNVTLQWLMERAEEARQGAMVAGQHAAAVSAIKELGILAGLRVEKREQQVRSVADMSDEELEAIARGEAPTRH